MNRYTWLAILTNLFVACAYGSERANEENKIPYSIWLGQQVNTGSLVDLQGRFQFHRRVVAKSSEGEYAKWEKIKGDLSIDLRIVLGEKLELPETDNGYTTLVNGEVGQISWREDLEIRPKNLYLVGEVKQLSHGRERYAYRYYTLNVRVLNNPPLEGAIVHLRNERIPASLEDPYVAIYKIPPEIKAGEGPLEYKVVYVGRK